MQLRVKGYVQQVQHLLILALEEEVLHLVLLTKLTHRLAKIESAIAVGN